MTTCLYSLLTAGSDRMAEVDPHGWTLTIISVSVVFLALIILYFIYTLSGNIFSGKIRFGKSNRAASGADDSDAIAAAIAMALEAENGGDDTAAAIATALHLYLDDGVHDIEPGIITIRHKVSGWDNKERNFRKSIQK